MCLSAPHETCLWGLQHDGLITVDIATCVLFAETGLYSVPRLVSMKKSMTEASVHYCA
jgi:hypothetical protein